MRRPLPILYLALALAGLVGTPAAAEAPAQDSAGQESARIAGEAGLKLYSAARWDEAFEAFQRAENALHAPTLVLYMAHCQRMRGKLVDARALYQRVIGEALGPDAPNQFLTAQLFARGELDRLRRRIPTLLLTITGARADLVRVTVDGAPFNVSPGIAQDLDPGDHAIIATAPGGAPIQRQITLNEGAASELSLSFEPHAGGAATRPSDIPSPPSTSTTPGADQSTPLLQRLPAPAWIAFGFGAAGLGVGAVTGAVALDEAGDIKARCVAFKHCRAEDQPRAEAAGRVADASTIGLLLGGAGVITGVVLWLALPKAQGARGADAVKLGVHVGPGLVTLEGAF